MDLQKRIEDLERELTRLHEAREMDRIVYSGETKRLKDVIHKREQDLHDLRASMRLDYAEHKELQQKLAKAQEQLRNDRLVDFKMLEQGGVIHVLALSRRGRLFAWAPKELKWKEFPAVPTGDVEVEAVNGA